MFLFPEEPSVCETCRLLSFSVQSFITLTFRNRFCLYLSLSWFIINKLFFFVFRVFGLQTFKSRTITRCWSNWFFINKKSFPLQVFKTLTLVLVLTVHTSVLHFEMEDIEPGDGEIPTRKLTWKPLGFWSHIKCRTIDDRFPLALWEMWFCSSLGVPISTLIGPSQ